MLDSNLNRMYMMLAGMIVCVLVIVFLFGSPNGDAEARDGYVDDVSSETIQNSQGRRHKY